MLTENLAILSFIGERHGTLLPAEGMARWRALEATSFMTSEIHGNFKPFFYPDATQAETDPYLFVMLRWATSFGIDISGRLATYLARMTQVPSVVRALGEEGLS